MSSVVNANEQMHTDERAWARTYVVRLDLSLALAHLRDPWGAAFEARIDQCHQAIVQLLDVHIDRSGGAIELVPYAACALHEARVGCDCGGQAHRAWDVFKRYLVEQAVCPQIDDSDTWVDAQGMRCALVSMDPWVYGNWRLQCARVFDSFESGQAQVQCIGYTHRPGCAPIQEQIQRLQEAAIQRVLLVDDDCASGGSVRHASACLAKNHIDCMGVHTLLPRGSYDVVDARDFVFGARHGGLLVHTQGGAWERKPYCLPWVDVSQRAKLIRQQAFTKKLIELNRSWTDAFGT